MQGVAAAEIDDRLRHVERTRRACSVFQDAPIDVDAFALGRHPPTTLYSGPSVVADVADHATFSMSREDALHTARRCRR